MSDTHEIDDGLDNRERIFVAEYLLDLNPDRAARAAGYAPSMARTKAYMWVSDGKTKPAVYRAVTEAIEARKNRLSIDADQVADELRKLAFSDIRRVVRWRTDTDVSEDAPEGGDTLVIRNIVSNNVELVSSDEVDDWTAAAISEISQTATGGIKVKMHDKRASLVDLGRHIGMFRDRVEITGKDGGPIETAHTARDRIADRLARLAPVVPAVDDASKGD